MHTVKISGKPYQVPTSIKEVTLDQFFKLKNAKGLIDEVCALTGLDKMEGMNFATPAEISKAYQMMAPIAKDLAAGNIEGKKMPDVVFIGGKAIDVPKQIKLEPVGAFIMVHDLMADETNKQAAMGIPQSEMNYTDLIPQTLAHYFYTKYYGGLYDDEKAESAEWMRLIMDIPFVQAVPIANFFFRKFPAL